jgi:hypothetical protein
MLHVKNSPPLLPTVLLAGLLAAAVAAGCGRCGASGPGSGTPAPAGGASASAPSEGAPPAPPETRTLCAGEAVPAGFVKVNDSWDPARCGKPAAETWNVWTVQRYDDRPVGFVMDQCTEAAIPEGWVLVAMRSVPEACGHPKGAATNVAKVRRVK